MPHHDFTSRLSGFYRISLQERRHVLERRFHLEANTLQKLDPSQGLQTLQADKLVENALGVFGLPVGVSANFIIDEEPVVVPMVTEEPSVIAACSHMAKLIALGGGFHTKTDERSLMVGQVQLVSVTDVDRVMEIIDIHKDDLMHLANQYCADMEKRGGGCVDVFARILPPVKEGAHAQYDNDGMMVVVHFVVDCCNAMGANVVNTVVEGVSAFLGQITSCDVGLRILSNLSDLRMARSSFSIPFRALVGIGNSDSGRLVADQIIQAYRFAARDPYRACTHNKGIMNGIDAVAVATGNDWRAIEAGAHAYAARSGQYTSLTYYWINHDNDTLNGYIELPMAVGIVGGSTKSNPAVQACKDILGSFAQDARKLAGLIASVGLAQNLGAMLALSTEGIQKGHMALHKRRGDN